MTTNIVNVFEPAQFGVGDGATTQFQIGGPREVVQSIAPTGVWRQDWQGNQRLYPTSRTNSFRSSIDLSNTTYWPRTRLTSVSPTTAPDGTSRAYTMTADAAGSGYSYQSYSVVTGQKYEISVFAKAGSSNVAYFQDFTQSGTAQFLLSGTGTVTGATGTMSAARIEALADGWYRCFAVLTPTATGSVNITASVVRNALASVVYFGPQIGALPTGSQGASSFIETAALPVTVTDYAASATGLITMGQVPAIGAALTWTGSYTYEYRDDEPTLADRTVISQYANSPTLRQLIQNMDEYINPDTDFDAFYDYVWNVETAQGFGLDIWGRIVGVGRMLTIPGASLYLGYQEAYTAPTASTGAQPFDQAPFYTGVQSSQTYRLADDAYRKLILVKALANISDCTSPSLNRLLSNLFAGRGRCYVSDTGKMEFRYVFEFALEPYEIAILTQSGAIPKPAAVQANVLQVDLPTTFGFNEALMQPFGSGVFFTSSGLINAS